MIRFISLCILLFAGLTHNIAQRVRVGAEVLLEKNLDLLNNKRVGIVCNQTSRLPNGTHLVDTLLQRGINITALFAAEHGIRGDHAAGVKVESQTDPKTGLPVYSLYGGTRKPTPVMLDRVDVVIFDMQDVGARFYTFGSTMAYVMEAAAENGKQIIVLDRPNPINGIDIEGPLLDMTLTSFLGLFPIPIRHGLTLGEMAKMIVGEGYINPSNVELIVIPMEGWSRSMWYDETGLPWISPSPNMKTLATATVYPGTCLFEATNISEGRGTPKPFEYIGAPDLDHHRLASKLNQLKLAGVRFTPIEFTPRSDSIAAPNPRFKNKLSRGVFVEVTDKNMFKPVLTGLMMFSTLHELYPKKFQVRDGLLSRLSGDESIMELLAKGKLDKNVLDRFKKDLTNYKQLRMKYLLYD